MLDDIRKIVHVQSLELTDYALEEASPSVYQMKYLNHLLLETDETNWRAWS